MRILYYAINGTGLGHLMRLAAVGREITKQDPEVHQLLVTNVPHSQYLTSLGIPFVVIPEDDSAPYDGLNRRSFRVSVETNAQMIFSFVQQYAPMLVVFDTHFPISLARKLHESNQRLALILRLCRQPYMMDLVKSGLLGTFDRILLPHTCQNATEVMSPRLVDEFKAYHACRFVGTIVRRLLVTREKHQSLALAYGLGPNCESMLITCGSGGSASAGMFFDRACTAAASLVLERPALRVLVVVGPSYRGVVPRDRAWQVVHSERELPLLMELADIVVGHGGYNTVNEILQGGTRAFLVALPCRHDDQASRIAELVGKGRAHSAALDAPAATYLAGIRAALDTPRPVPVSFMGASLAAHELLDCIPRILRLALMPAAPPNPAWEGVASLHELVARFRTSDSRQAAVLLRPESFRPFLTTCDLSNCAYWVDLGDGSAEELVNRAKEAVATTRELGKDMRALRLTFVDDKGGAALMRVCAEMATTDGAQTIVARAPAEALASLGAEYASALEFCRGRWRKVTFDLTSAETACLEIDRSTDRLQPN